jgi:hypothetical protein
VVEIEERGGLAVLLEHAGVLAAAGRVEFDKVARRVVFLERAVLAQRGQRDPLQQFRIARAERLFGGQAIEVRSPSAIPSSACSSVGTS